MDFVVNCDPCWRFSGTLLQTVGKGVGCPLTQAIPSSPRMLKPVLRRIREQGDVGKARTDLKGESPAAHEGDSVRAMLLGGGEHLVPHSSEREQR